MMMINKNINGTTNGKMKAVRFLGNKKLEIIETPIPKPPELKLSSSTT